jgi:phosphohistidine phosphatase
VSAPLSTLNVRLFLIHHGEAVGSDVDPRRPLSPRGQTQAERVAADAASRGAKPVVVWHSGKLRSKQTAEAFWRACNPFAEFAATRDVQPDDPPQWIHDRLRAETRDIAIAGHFPHLPRLVARLIGGVEDFPAHGAVALATDDDGETWRELWRIENG